MHVYINYLKNREKIKKNIKTAFPNFDFKFNSDFQHEHQLDDLPAAFCYFLLNFKFVVVTFLIILHTPYTL